MAQFEPGKVLKTASGEPVTVLRYLTGGGRGDVYAVEYAGKKKALKWYRSVGNDPDAFYNNLNNSARLGSPDKVFLWPETLTERSDGSFGYIMELRPEGYAELSNFILEKVRFASFRVMVDACIRVVSAFRHLNARGYSFQDLNDGHFFLHPQTGDVRICNNDTLAPYGTNMGIVGKPRYMAPEVVYRHLLPDACSNRFSLAVILFFILCLSHPLEGKKSLIPCLTPQAAEKLYGSQALFIYDPQNNANAPLDNIHTNAIRRWAVLPDYVKKAFVSAFDRRAIKEPERRLTELDWLKVLVRFRGDIVSCECGNEVFVKNAATVRCDGCGSLTFPHHAISLPDYTAPARQGSLIYRCQLGNCTAAEALTPVALVVAKEGEPSVLGLQNLTDETLNATTPSGNVRQVLPKETVPFKAGIVLEAFGSELELK